MLLPIATACCHCQLPVCPFVVVWWTRGGSLSQVVLPKRPIEWEPEVKCHHRPETLVTRSLRQPLASICRVGCLCGEGNMCQLESGACKAFSERTATQNIFECTTFVKQHTFRIIWDWITSKIVLPIRTLSSKQFLFTTDTFLVQPPRQRPGLH